MSPKPAHRVSMTDNVELPAPKKAEGLPLPPYNALVGAVRLASVDLVDFSATREPEVGEGPLQANVQVLDVRAVKVQIEDAENPHIVCEVPFLFTGLSADDKPFVRMEARYVVTYELRSKADPADADLQVFGKRQAVFNSWSFARELIANFAWRMGIPIPPLAPLLHT